MLYNIFKLFSLFLLYHYRAVFIADQRFLALKQPDKFWTLQIKYVQARDAGAYECQVSTEPKVSARVHLQVVGKLFNTLFFVLYCESMKNFLFFWETTK